MALKPSKAQGMSFFEILLALFILSYSLMALSSLYIRSIAQTEKNFFTHLAMLQIHSMANRLMANPMQIPSETNQWNQENAVLMPQGKGTISGQNPYKITLSWFDKISASRVRITKDVFL